MVCGGVGIVFGADAGLSFAGVVAGFAVGFLAAGAAFEGPESLDEGAVGVSEADAGLLSGLGDCASGRAMTGLTQHSLLAWESFWVSRQEPRLKVLSR